MNMRNYTRFLGHFFRILLLIPIIFLASCGTEDDEITTDGTGSTNPPNTSSPADIAAITDSQAKSTATKLISENLNTSIAAIGDVTSNSSAVNTIAKSLGLDLSTINASTSSVRSTRADDSTTAAIEQQLIDALDAMISNGTRVGATITYAPDEEALCNDALLGLVPDLVDQVNDLVDDADDLIGEGELDTSDAIDACTDLLEDLTIVLTILGEESGILAIKMYDFTFLTIGYSTNESYAELDLAQMKSIIEAIGDEQVPAEDPDLPSTFEGVIRLTNTILGTDHARVTLSFEESIKIVDDSEDKETSILLSKAAKVIEFEANANDNTASVEVALAAIEAFFPIDDVNEEEQQAELSIDGLTMKANLTSSGDQLVVTNIGLGNAPLLFNIVDLTSFIISDDPNDLELTLENFGFNIDGTEESITFSSLFDATLEIDDRFGIITDDDFFAGRLDVDINDNTVLTPKVNSSEDPIFEVTSGFVSQQGSGDFDFGGSFVQGQCFSLNLAAVLSPDLPFKSESCF